MIPGHGIVIPAAGEPGHPPPNMESSTAVAGADHAQWPMLTRNHLVATSQHPVGWRHATLHGRCEYVVKITPQGRNEPGIGRCVR